MKTLSSKEIIERLKIGLELSSDNALADTLGVSKTTLSNWKSRNSLDFPLVFSLCEHISLDWLLTGKGKMLKSNAQEDEEAAPKISYNPQVGQPYYDVDFLAGFDEVFNSQVSIPACNVVVPGFTRVSLWCNVTGHSMEPQINHGDMIALRECTVRDIQYGEVYAVVLDTIRTIKIIRKGSSPKVLRYIPVNEKYDEQEFEIERIIKVYEVVGNISKFI
ncbi:LexA family transcriptional regulator [Hallella colorans]|uniref:LexA family transcriptional regulator n=1 Tax=Hallella colorans TaxID=1703337 RepID=UPI0023F10A3D|nr:helix-turn-helix domain-containing protein [Hallella colorans]